MNATILLEIQTDDSNLQAIADEIRDAVEQNVPVTVLSAKPWSRPTAPPNPLLTLPPKTN